MVETNGKVRTAEAEAVRARMRELHAAHPEALPEGRTWRGLEPWYALTCEVDWLEACAPP